MDVIEVSHLKKIYEDGNQAIDDVSFSIKPGEGVTILGHNGSGKSTLFRCLTSFEKITAGTISIQGKDTAKLSKKELRHLRKDVGMVFQHFNLVNNLSVFQNVLFGALGEAKTTFHTFSLFAPKELREKAMECLSRVGLAHLAKRRADQLSGGQKQRVAIARMLMQNPKIVLADVPIASLDPKAGREVMELLFDIVREKKLTVVCILHQVEIAMEYSDRIIALKKGNVVFDEDKHAVTPALLEGLYDLEEDDDKQEDLFVATERLSFAKTEVLES